MHMCMCIYIIYQWLEEDFLGYLKEWELDVESHGGLDAGAQRRMLLSQETLEGLEITGIHVCMHVNAYICMLCYFKSCMTCIRIMVFISTCSEVICEHGKIPTVSVQ